MEGLSNNLIRLLAISSGAVMRGRPAGTAINTLDAGRIYDVLDPELSFSRIVQQSQFADSPMRRDNSGERISASIRITLKSCSKMKLMARPNVTVVLPSLGLALVIRMVRGSLPFSGGARDARQIWRLTTRNSSRVRDSSKCGVTTEPTRFTTPPRSSTFSRLDTVVAGTRIRLLPRYVGGKYLARKRNLAHLTHRESPPFISQIPGAGMPNIVVNRLKPWRRGNRDQNRGNQKDNAEGNVNMATLRETLNSLAGMPGLFPGNRSYHRAAGTPLRVRGAPRTRR